MHDGRLWDNKIKKINQVEDSVVKKVLTVFQIHSHLTGQATPKRANDKATVGWNDSVQRAGWFVGKCRAYLQ